MLVYEVCKLRMLWLCAQWTTSHCIQIEDLKESWKQDGVGITRNFIGQGLSGNIALLCQSRKWAVGKQILPLVDEHKSNASHEWQKETKEIKRQRQSSLKEGERKKFVKKNLRSTLIKKKREKKEVVLYGVSEAKFLIPKNLSPRRTFLQEKLWWDFFVAHAGTTKMYEQ